MHITFVNASINNSVTDKEAHMKIKFYLCGQKNQSTAKTGPSGPSLAAKTDFPCQFWSPCENVNWVETS